MTESRSPDDHDPDRRRQLAETRDRLTRLEAETHRLRAQLARLEAAGEDEQARRLEEQIAELDGRRTAAGGTTVPARRADRIVDRQDAAAPRVDPGPGRQAATQEQPSAGRDLGAEPVPKHEEPAAVAPLSIAIDPPTGPEEQRRRTIAARLRDAPAWATSLGVHALLLIVFSLATFVTLQEQPPMLLGSAPDGEDEYFDEVAEVSFEPTDLELATPEVTSLEPTEVTDFEINELDNPWDSAALGSTDFAPGLASSLPTDAASLMLGESGGRPEGGRSRGDRADGGGPPGSTRFFGAASKGNRFVFVVDNSGSMKRGRLETTLFELRRAVEGMSAKQFFYIIFYSDQAYPMFYPDSTAEMLPATRENKRRLGAWLPTVEMCSGGRLKEAIEMAIDLQPGVVYLLSDGEIGSTRTMKFLTEDVEWGFTIHTLGMGVDDNESAGKLMAIARASRGAFKPVQASPAAVQMARQRPIPYHNNGPGPVWGSKVRVRN